MCEGGGTGMGGPTGMGPIPPEWGGGAVVPGGGGPPMGGGIPGGGRLMLIPGGGTLNTMGPPRDCVGVTGPPVDVTVVSEEPDVTGLKQPPQTQHTP